MNNTNYNIMSGLNVISADTFVIATGCPSSGWDAALATLENSGLISINGPLAQWHAELYENERLANPLVAPKSIIPDSDFVQDVSEILSLVDKTSPSLIYDNRSLWLLDFWAEHLPQAFFLLFYNNADTAMAQALVDESCNPREFLNDWVSTNRYLIQFQIRHRKRAILLNTESVIKHPENFIKLLNHSFGLDHIKIDPDFLPTYNIPLVEYLLSKQFVLEHPSAQLMQSELNARAQPVSERAQTQGSSPEELLVKYFQHRALATESEQNSKLMEDSLYSLETSLIQADISMQQLILERNSLEILSNERLALLEEAIQVKDEQSSQTLEQQRVIQQLTTDRNDLSKLANARLSQLEQAIKDRDEQFNLAREQKETINQLTEEANSIRTEKTSLMRNVTELEGTISHYKNKTNAAEKDNDQLTKRLHETQEELETYYLKNQDLTKLIQEHESLFSSYTKTHKDFALQIAELKKSNDLLLNKLHTANRENDILLNKLHSVKGENEILLNKLQKTHGENDILLNNLNAINREFTNYIKTQMNDSSSNYTSISDKLLTQFSANSKYVHSEKLQLKTIRDSGLFEESWYLTVYPDVAKDNVDPILHYIRHGVKELRNPSAKFNTLEYLKSNPSVLINKINPLVHYIKNANQHNN